MFAKVILLLLLSASIVYFNKIPANIRRFANGIPGRLILFVSIIAMYETAGWMPAMLMTLISLLLIASSTSIEGFIGENFSADIDIIEKKPGTKWWDEVLLGRESIVKTQLVDTQPVQG
jgi:glucose-6-phosphate-specific signal transduction histidine kinase